jgi:hypothetical protein
MSELERQFVKEDERGESAAGLSDERCDDVSDGSVQALVTEMQDLAREAAQDKNKKRRFSKRLPFGRARSR